LPTRYRFDLATPADDARLRAVSAATPMPGSIGIAFCREPSFFAAAEVEGPFHQTVACRADDQIVGFGNRSVSTRWVNGRPQSIGYLSLLRLVAEHRRRGLVPRGYAFFRRLHDDGRTPLYLTTIADDNHAALELLTSGRAGLPAYHEAGRYHTFVLNRRRLPHETGRAEVTIRRATTDDRPAIVDFLASEGPRRQFFPQVGADELFADRGLLRGLAPHDLWLAWRGGRMCGTLGMWDQRPFRQQRIVGYNGRLRRLRPIYNLFAPWTARPVLPPPGATLACRFAALPVAHDHDPKTLLPLLRTALTESLGDGESLLFGLHDADPWRPVVSPLAVLCYTTRLFLVCFADGESFREHLDARPPYLELGCL
jgi:hypothetical protein